MGTRRLSKTLSAAAALAVLTAAGGSAALTFARQHDTARRTVVVLNREGSGSTDNRHIGAVPDTTAAVGRRHYLEAVNSRLALYDAKTLKLVRARDHFAFWGRSNRSGSIEDPQVAWDDRARRWYYAALFTGPSGNSLLFAWTRRGDPANLSRRAWCRTSIRSGEFIDDFPHLGFSRNHILIATNLFNLDREFQSARIWVLGKPSPRSKTCTRPPVTSFGSPSEPLHRADGRIAFTLVPVIPARPGDRAYLVAADCVFDPEPGEEDACGTRERQGNQITAWHVEGARGSPRLERDGGIDVPIYRLPSPASQRGAKTKLDTSDTRLYQAVSAPDPTLQLREAIWTQHTVAGPGGRSELRWYELDPKRLRSVRRGTIRSARDWIFSGAISPTAMGDRAVVHYNASGPGHVPVLRARSRGPRTAKARMTSEVTVARSNAADRTCDKEPQDPCPWGDYAAATPDPVRRGLVWGSNELVGSPRHRDRFGRYWRTRNFALRAP